MEFQLKEKLPQTVDMSANVAVMGKHAKEMVAELADKLTVEEYHELCHQLHGTKSEFDGADDGECHADHVDKYRYTVNAALYRGIFWSTLNALDQLG